MKSKFTSRTPWREKMERPEAPKLVTITPKMSRLGQGVMLISTPKLVDALIRKVPKGRLITVGAIRKLLAGEFKADVTCPLTTGIFIRIVAEAAEEARAEGAKRITPYWRVIRDNGELNPKFPGGVNAQARYLRAEGLTVRSDRKVPTVKEFEGRQIRF
jgi:alkylated DNA nucleotide flippase Atl1